MRKNSILDSIAKEYVVHFDHPEVTNDVDGSMTDHKNLLEDDQDCVETKVDVKQMDKENTGNCVCDDCVEIKTTAKKNCIASRLRKESSKKS